MGQEQSAPAPRRATNRLSKPRTNSSGNLLSKIPGTPSRQNSQSNNGSPTKSRYSLAIPDAAVDEAGEKKEEKPRKRMSLFRSKSSQAKEKYTELNTAVERVFAEPAPVELPVRRHSRANSITFEDQAHEDTRPVNRSRMSLQHFPYTQHHSRLSLVQERQPQEPVIDDEPVISRYEDAGAQNSLPRTQSESNIYGPIRRRSLLQHGVATRKSLFAENDSRQSLPSQIHADEFQDYYYNPSKPTSSPLSNLAALRGTDNGSPGPRVETPTDQGYGHIGVYKLGSLRITNGAASPAPSEGRPTTSDDDYLTAGAKRYEESDHRPRASQRSNTLAAPSEALRPSWVVRSESPLRQAENFHREPLTVDTGLPLPDPSFALFNFGSTDSPTKSLDLAKRYIEDLAMSPFSFDDSPPQSPRLQATSKHTAVEDDLFAPEPNSPKLEPVEHVPRSFDSGYGTGGTERKSILGPRDPTPKPLEKADSGYSSNVSLRSFRKDSVPAVPSKEAPPTPPKEMVSRVPSSTYSVASRVPSSAYSVASEASDTTLRAQRSLPALPAQEYIPPPPLREAPPVPPKRSPQREAIPENVLRNSIEPSWEVRRRPSLDASPKHIRQQSLPAIPKAIRELPKLREMPSNSSDSNSSTGSRWRSSKVQKQRPHSVQPTPVYTVQATRTPSETIPIPPVSPDASRKLEQRVDAFPVQSFANTIAGSNNLRRSVSKETLGTIFSVGSAEVRDELSVARLQSALPPVPVHASIPEYAPTSPEQKHTFAEQKPDYNRRNTYQPTTTSTPIPAKKSFDGRRYMQPKSREPSPLPVKSVEQRQEEYEDQVTSFDAISSSLGKSPYEIASNAMSRPATSGSSRAKSLTSQFEAEAAERFQSQKRNVSGGSSILQNRKSYDSISGGNPFTPASNGNTSPHSTGRRSSRGYPPQAHSNASAKRPFAFVPPVQPPSPSPAQARIGDILSLRKAKSSPPVSMQTQRKSLPPPRAAPSAPSVAPPQPPTAAEQDPWAQPSTFWAERRKSAGEALQTRRSMEMSRPGSARPSYEYQRPAARDLRAYGSFDQSQDHYEMQQGYDHSYGSYSHGSNYNGGDEQEYYGQEDEQEYIPAEEVRRHTRSTSTEEMLVLDRYTGGLGYGFEGHGIVGSAGTRNSGTLLGGGAGRKGEQVAREWGVDLSDVPVFLQRVAVNH